MTAAADVTLGLVGPVRRLLAGTVAVEGGALDTVVPITSRDEIGRLTQSFNSMVGELRVKAQIRETFGKYVGRRADRPAAADRRQRLAPRDDNLVLRYEGFHHLQRRHDASRAGHRTQPLYDGDVGAGPAP